ncbi:MAG: energy transducer TonB [Firmicutes bacterium]|nr:energy transducer TonB [Bacillota bacterium]
MSFFDNEETYMSRFIFLSIVIHAILFLTYPQWSSLLVSDSPGFEKGGVIQVVYQPVDSNTREESPVTDRSSVTTVPQVEPPRPTSEPPKELAAVAPVPADIPEVAIPRPEPAPEPKPELEPQPLPEPVEVTVESAPTPEVSEPVQEIERPIVQESGELLTSEHGREVVVEEQQEQKDQRLAAAAPVDPTAPAQPVVEEQRPDSSTGQELIGGESDLDVGTQESGVGEAEVAPPPPPPPPSGRSAHIGGRNPIYPKDAEHEGIEGTVTLDVTVSRSGQVIDVELVASSGDPRLDLQAIQTIKLLWEFQGMYRDYVVTLDIEFTRATDGSFGSQVHYGDTRWLE